MPDPKEDKRLFLLDAYALIYRAYFAFGNNQRVNSQGLNTSAVLGFTNTLLEVLNKEKPTHIAVVFDTAEPTTRHEDFTDYKAGREAMPEDIAKAIQLAIEYAPEPPFGAGHYRDAPPDRVERVRSTLNRP